MIKLSIIVPVYNVEQYIDRCLESLVNQTLKDIEIIIVNDGSEDKSEEIILKYKEKYPEKIVYLKKKNGGLSDARNFALPYVRGEYLTFLDSDDYIDLEAYEVMCNATNGGSKKIIECNFLWEYSNKIKKDNKTNYKSIKDYMINGRVVAWNKLYKSDWFLKSNILFPIGLLYEDLEVFFKILPLLDGIEDVEVVDKFFVHYTQRQDAITYVETERVAHILDVYSNVFQYYKDLGIYNEYRDELEYKYCRNLMCSFLKKVMYINDKKVRQKLLIKFWNSISYNFPKWKDNIYLKNRKLPINIYLRLMNSLIIRILYIR